MRALLVSPSRSARSLVVVAAAIAATGCSEFARPAARAARSGLSFVPAFSTASQTIGPALASAGLQVDHIHIVLYPLVSAGGSQDTVGTAALLDTTIVVLAGTDSVSLDLTVAADPGASLNAALQYESGTTVLFSGSAIVTAHAVGSTVGNHAVADTIHVSYVGPGANAATVLLTPLGGTLPATQADTFTAVPKDAQGNALATPVVFSVSDTTLATISVVNVANDVTTAVLSPKGSRGSITVTATALNGVSAKRAVNLVTGAAAVLVDSSSLNQVATVGTNLSQPFLVQVQAADGNVVPGATVTFAAVTGKGGKVNPATAVTDSLGRAKTTVTLDTVAGISIFRATASTGSATLTAGATSAAATQLVKISSDTGAASCTNATAGTAVCDTVTKRLSAPFVVQASDKYNNVVPGVGITWTKRSASGIVRFASTTTSADGRAADLYILGNVAGIKTDTVQATITGSATSVTFVASALTGPAGARVAVSLVIFGDTIVTITGGTIPSDFPYVLVSAADGSGVPSAQAQIAITGFPAGFTNPCPSTKPCTATGDSYGNITIQSTVAPTNGGITAIKGSYTITVTATLNGKPVVVTFHVTVQ